MEEHKFGKYWLEENYLGIDDNPPTYTVGVVKQLLWKNNFKFSKKNSGQRLRRITYEAFKIDSITDFEEILKCETSIDNYSSIHS